MKLMYITQHMYDVLKYPFGGLEIHVRDLISNLPHNYEVFVFSPSYKKKHYLVTIYQAGKRKKIQKWEYGKPITMHMISEPRYAKLLTDVIRYNKINLVHIHNCIDHTFDISSVCENENIAVIKGEHDYYNIAGENFQKDFTNRYNLTDINKSLWTEKTADFYRKLDFSICYCDKSIQIFQQYFPNTSYKKIPHGITASKNQNPYFLENHGKKRFVFCGRIAKEKGAVELFEAILQVDSDIFEFHIFGMWEPDMIEWQTKIAKQTNVFVHGRYDNHKLFAETFKELKPQFAFIVSDWDETFNYVLSEMMQQGIFPIATARGAMKERIEQTGFGLLIETNSVQNIIESILKTMTLDLNQYAKFYYEMQLPTVNEMVTNYDVLYTEFASDASVAHAVQKPLMFKSKLYALNQMILLPIAFSRFWVSTKRIRDNLRKRVFSGKS